MAREYKDSGVAWAEQIPSDWKVIRGKNLLKLMNRPVRETDDVVTCFRDGEVILRSERRTEGFTMSDKEIGYQGINKGDIVIHGMDGFAGSMGVSKSTGKGSPVLVVCNPKDDDDSRYIIYYLRALAMNNVFIALATGIRERSCDLRWNKISELPFIQPKASEQKLIADYLDEKCGEIDKLVSLQEQMIEELKAYKQSVITEAVTKGLNPDVEFVPSGIDWIGDVPKGWYIVALRYLFTIKAGGDAKPELYSDTLDLLHPYPVYTNTLDATQVYAYTSLPVFKGNSITVTGRGAVGHAIYRKNDYDAIIRLLSLSPKCYAVDCRYYAYYIDNVLHIFTNNAAIAQLSTEQLAPYKVLLPSLVEQRTISSYLDAKCAEIDKLILIKQNKISELKKYKKSIIFEYVTGKKQVV